MREALNARRVLVDQKRQMKTKIENESIFCDKIQLTLLLLFSPIFIKNKELVLPFNFFRRKIFEI
jgi:hypothetical protein